MRVTSAVALAVVAVVSRRGDGGVAQSDDALNRLRVRQRPFDAHLPRRTVGLGAARAQLAADLDQIRSNLARIQQPGERIHREALGNGGKIHVHLRAPLSQRRRRRSGLELAVARRGHGGFDLPRRGRPSITAPGAEPPEIDDPSDGHVESTTGKHAHGSRRLDDSHRVGGHGKPVRARAGVEPRELRVGTPRGHLRVDALEARVDSGLECAHVEGVIALQQLHRIGGAHGRAGDDADVAGGRGLLRRGEEKRQQKTCRDGGGG